MSTELLDCGHAPDPGQPWSNGETQRNDGWTFILDFDGKRRICKRCADARILDCGHTPSPHSPMTTGYGTDPDTGKRSCYACCAAKERESMIATGRAVLYLCAPYGGPTGKPYRVTDWPGELSFPVTSLQRSRHGGGFGSQRTDAWFHGPDGYVWHAINRGDNDIARCRRTREKTK